MHKDNLFEYFSGLSPEQLSAAHKWAQKKFASDKVFDAPYQTAATNLSRTQLKEELLREKLRPLAARAKVEKAALDAAGHRPGPSPAFRWLAARIAPSRAAWEDLTPAEKKAKDEALREELMLTDEFAILFPAEGYQARTRAGVEPGVLIALDDESEFVDAVAEVAQVEVAVDEPTEEGASTAAV